jgi:3-methyladenine DNA glycosylase AlkD
MKKEPGKRSAASAYAYAEIIRELKSHGKAKNVAGMARFGINPHKALGVSVKILREQAKRIGKDHALAQELWNSQIHEARILATLVDEPSKVTQRQMDAWVRDFDSWDICDQACMNLFRKTPRAFGCALRWSARKEEFVKRAGFVLVATLAVHEKAVPDEQFVPFFALIEKESDDARNFVKKAVNWALRQLGKRSLFLREKAVVCALKLQQKPSSASRWIAADALRELRKDG